MEGCSGSFYTLPLPCSLSHPALSSIREFLSCICHPRRFERSGLAWSGLIVFGAERTVNCFVLFLFRFSVSRTILAGQSVRPIVGASSGILHCPALYLPGQ